MNLIYVLMKCTVEFCYNRLNFFDRCARSPRGFVFLFKFSHCWIFLFENLDLFGCQLIRIIGPEVEDHFLVKAETIRTFNACCFDFPDFIFCRSFVKIMAVFVFMDFFCHEIIIQQDLENL